MRAILLFVGMVVNRFILFVDMGVGVQMFVRMRMDQIAVPVFVGVYMRMLMGVLQADGVLDHQNRGNNHNGQTHIELDAGPLIQQ